MPIVESNAPFMKRQNPGQVGLELPLIPQSNDQGHMVVTQAMARYFEAARQGKIFTACIGTSATYKATVITPPNVGAATWLLYNDNPTSGNVCLIPTWIAWYSQGTTTADVDAGTSLAVQVPTGPQTKFTADYADIIRGGPTGRSGGSNAYLGNNKTVIGAQGSWVTFPTSLPDNGQEGTGHGVDPEGMFIVKPGHGLWIEYIGGATGVALGGPSIMWIEAEADCL